MMRSSCLLGYFPFHLHILLYHYPSRRVFLVSLFGICRTDSLIAGLLYDNCT